MPCCGGNVSITLYGAAQYQLALQGILYSKYKFIRCLEERRLRGNLCAQSHKWWVLERDSDLLLYLEKRAWTCTSDHTWSHTAAVEQASSSRHWVVTLSCFYEVSAICPLSQERVGEIRCLVRGLTAILQHPGALKSLMPEQVYFLWLYPVTQRKENVRVTGSPLHRIKVK